jgi:hypothetical protein
MRCPRCNSDQVTTMVKSPVGDVWEVYVCKECSYSWRSTEKISILPIFRLDQNKIGKIGVIPPIPPLKEECCDE